MQLPYPITKLLIHFLASKCTIVMTNVFGPPLPLTVNGGIKSTKAQCLLPGLCDVAGGFAIVSHVDTITISFQCDRSKCEEPEVIIKMFENTLDSFINCTDQ